MILAIGIGGESGRPHVGLYMNYCYYPGCTLKTQAQELDEYARLSAQVLGIGMQEPENWQCCGAVYPLARDEIATRLSSVRVLEQAKANGQSVLTLCSACHHVIKRVNNDMATNADIQGKVSRYLELKEPYTGETSVVHYLEMLRDAVGFAELKAKVKHPLKGKRIAAYYGCLLLRPSSVMQFDNAENPTIMEDFIRALGATPVVYPYRNECCGGYVALKDTETVRRMCSTIMASAKEKGAEMLITACPLCMYNLQENGGEPNMPVVYFTQLLAEALGVAETKGERVCAS